jgi:hypothetical protein
MKGYSPFALPTLCSVRLPFRRAMVRLIARPTYRRRIAGHRQRAVRFLSWRGRQLQFPDPSEVESNTPDLEFQIRKKACSLRAIQTGIC